jgi:SAM-dependent methyltransferase
MNNTENKLPPVHIALMQPAGQVHALALLDAARYARFQLRRFGGEVTLCKNRLREDAVNLVFGAHQGFAPEWLERHACVFFNLEQLGEGGATLDPAYLELLKRSAVVDYDGANRAVYAARADDVPLVPILHAPYLERADALPLEERQIDLLFIGTMNERRKRFIERIEACGLTVAAFDHPVYGQERDDFIRQARAVINCHYYPSSRFEQVRVAHCLSLGTPVISERSATSVAFDQAVFWLDDDASFERFWRETFATPAFFDAARARLAAWRTHDPVDAYAELMAFAAGVFQVHVQSRSTEPWRPNFVNLGSGKDYKPGWLNLDVIERAEPDLVLDLAQPAPWPIESRTRFGATLRLEANSVQAIYANNVLEHVSDLPALMGNALALLADGGLFEIEVPYEKAPTAWQDPTHVRAFNPKSWLYYTDWFWYLGWFTHRFEIAASGWMDGGLRNCDEPHAQFMRVTLRKVATTPHERTMARAWRADFGGLPEDEPPAVERAPLRLVVVDEGAAAPASAIDTLLAEALPAARAVLEIGSAAHSVEAAWRRRHPAVSARWLRMDRIDAAPAETFDLIVLSAPTESLADPDTALTALRAHAHAATELVLAADNRASWSDLEALLEGDTAPRGFSPASLTRLLLDAGWLPDVAARRDAPAPQGDFAPAAVLLAQTSGVPAATAERSLSAERFVMRCTPAPDLPAVSDGTSARFSVVVPTTREGQFRRNVQASPGLAEVGAPIVAYRGAVHAAEALEESLAHVATDWVLYAHQDIYFPRSFGTRLNALLATIPEHERRHTLIGFAGLAAEGDRAQPAGLVIDRGARFDHPASDAAISIDELAIVIARDSVHRIDPALGWHLWATDLCLGSIATHQRFARIVRVPLFHHSSNDFTLPAAFHRSAEVLAAKHGARFGPIATLCGTIGGAQAQAAA